MARTRRGDGSRRRWETWRKRKELGHGVWEGEGEVAPRGIVKLKNRRKRTRRRNGASPRKAVSKVWAAQTRARGLGRTARASQTQIYSPRVDRACLLPGAASLAPLELPHVSASISTGRGGPSLPVALLGKSKQPRGCPDPRQPRGQARARPFLPE